MELLLAVIALWAVGELPFICHEIRRHREVDIVKMVIEEREKQEIKRQKAINKLNRKG